MDKDTLLSLLQARDEELVKLKRVLHNIENSFKAFILMLEVADNTVALDPREFPLINESTLDVVVNSDGVIIFRVVMPGETVIKQSPILLQ